MAPTHAQIVGCLLWMGGGCAMVHGDGPASGQAGLDRPGQAGQASECMGGQGCVEEQELASKLKSKPCKGRYASRLATTPPPFAKAVVTRLRDGDYSTTRVGSEWALGSRNEGYSRRGGTQCSIRTLSTLLRDIVPASCGTMRRGGRRVNPVGSRQYTFLSPAHSHLVSEPSSRPSRLLHAGIS